MAGITLDELMGQEDWQEMNKWDIQVIRSPEKLAGFDLTKNFHIFGESAQIPNRTTEQIEVWNKGERGFTTGNTTVAGTIPLTFFDTVKHPIIQMFEAWQLACKNFGAQKVKGDIRLVLLDRSKKEVYEYILKGCFPTEVDKGSLESTSAEPQKISVTISYDDYTSRAL